MRLLHQILTTLITPLHCIDPNTPPHHHAHSMGECASSAAQRHILTKYLLTCMLSNVSVVGFGWDYIFNPCFLLYVKPPLRFENAPP